VVIREYRLISADLSNQM